jgi:hypothetical protein
VILFIAAAFIVAVVYAAIRVSKTFPPKQRVIFWIVVALGAAWYAPRIIRGFMTGYSMGAEYRRTHGG